MAITLEQYQQLKHKADEAQREADRLQGSLENMKSRIKSEFNCTTIEEAKILLDKMKQEERNTTEQFQRELELFKGRWPQLQLED